MQQGGADEEAQLARYLLELIPTSRSLADIGELGEVLLLLGHVGDARVLQSEAAKVVRLAGEVVNEIRRDLPKGVTEEQLGHVLGVVGGKGTGPQWKWEVLRD